MVGCMFEPSALCLKLGGRDTQSSEGSQKRASGASLLLRQNRVLMLGIGIDC